MEKPLPMTPDVVKGTRAVTKPVAKSGSGDLEAFLLTKRLRARQTNRSSRYRRIKSSVLSCTQRIYMIVGPEQSNRPNGSTVIWSVVGFIAFLGFGCVAVALPRRPMLITFGVAAFLVSSSLAALVASDLRSRGILSLLDLLEAYTDHPSTGSSCLPEKYGKYHSDYDPNDTFLHNASQAKADSSAAQSPSLWLAVHDPQLSLSEALRMGYTRMILVAANGNNAINLGLKYRQAPHFTPAYDYGLSYLSLPPSAHLRRWAALSPSPTPIYCLR
ncbi:MAG: hypothetical protein Q9212_002442 [Teloschistes hypoglaucus]